MAELMGTMGYEFCVSVFACCFVAFYLMYVSQNESWCVISVSQWQRNCRFDE